MTNLRGPLRNYRLGVGGINELLSMQSRTGINARMQAGSVEGIRTLMGYGYSAGDVTNYIESMGQADTVNRMFMMTGTSLYGIGGRQKSAQQVNQELIQRLGLNNREIIQAGRQSGSVIRQRMQMAGLDQGAQDILLQYAESNVGFRERGGKGFYDPSSKADRKRMGIEGNYATQAEETERVKVDREEQMYKRQADNYSQMERNLQNVNKLLKEFEDRLRGVVGGKTRMRGFGQFLSPALGIAGAVGGLVLSGGNPMGAMAGYSVGSGIGSFFGDATQGTGSASPGRIASENPTKKVKNEAQLSSLKPVLREPLARLLSDRPGISIGQGYRSPDQQKAMFLSRYFKTDKETDTYYDGSYWEKKPGVAKAAPPGLSYHEIGLAADLIFATEADRQWLKQNASKYGLDEFSRIGEPWHVQSKAYPSRRKDYEQGGATYGTDTNADTKYVIGTTGNVLETGPMGQSGQGMSEQANIVQQMSVAESMAAFANARTTTLLYGGKDGNSSGGGGGRAGSVTSANASRGGEKVGHGTTQEEQKNYYRKLRNQLGQNIVSRSAIANYLRNVTVRGRKLTAEEINHFVNIAGRETGGTYDANAYNDDNATSDFSFGLLQLNLQGDNKKDLFRLFPQFKKDYSGLWDPQTNIEVAAGWLMRDGDTTDRGNNIYHHWGGQRSHPESTEYGYKLGKNGQGDPYDTGYTPLIKSASTTNSGSSSKATIMDTKNVFNVSPTINISSTGSAPVDATKIAKEVTKILEREVRMTAVRNS
mgnify:CR=1 FL=1